jgi:uncharacterized protein with PIN domain
MARLARNINMWQVTCHFHDRLANYLATGRQARGLDYTSNGPTAVKHVIEALGVPHTEVECILANDRPVGFAYLVQAGDRLDVYPVIPPQIQAPVRLRPVPPTPARFVADNHLGRLVTYLRLLGFDTLYPNHLDDAGLADLAADQERVLLSRDRRLLMRKIVVHGLCLQSRDPRQQLDDVLDRFDLRDAIAPWKRCLRCNGLLRPVAKEAIIGRLEPLTKKYYHEFHICQECQQIYWKGSHYGPLHDLVAEVLARSLGRNGA